MKGKIKHKENVWGNRGFYGPSKSTLGFSFEFLFIFSSDEWNNKGYTAWGVMMHVVCR